MSVRYRGISPTELVNEEDESKKSQSTMVEKASAKIHSALWIIAAIVIIYWSDFFTVALEDSRVNRYALVMAVSSFLSSMMIMLYLTLWLPLIMRITIPWEIYCPNMIPASTALGVSSYVLMIIAFWPVWGLLTPFMLTVMLIAFLFTSHFIPWPC